MDKYFNIMPEWQNFAKSGYTGLIGPHSKL